MCIRDSPTAVTRAPLGGRNAGPARGQRTGGWPQTQWACPLVAQLCTGQHGRGALEFPRTIHGRGSPPGGQ
eukprot:2114951-Lingulodinium_polyedra.AAC.1